MTASDRPTDWPRLMAELRADPGMTAHGFAFYMRELKDETPAAIGFGGGLMRAAEVLNRGLIMGQGAAMGRIVTLLQNHAAAIAAADEDAMLARPAMSQAILASALVAELGGFGDWTDLRATAFERLWSRPPDGDASDVTTAWAGLAWGQADRAADHIGRDAEDPAPRVPGDAQRRISRTMLDAGPMAEAEAAWHDWLVGFPTRLVADETNWNHLMWSARAVHVVIGGMAPQDLPAHVAQVLDTL